VSSMKDVEALCAVAGQGVVGAIVGRAIYEGSLDLVAAQQMADQCK